MAAKVMKDYFTGTVTADYTATTLSIVPHNEATEEMQVRQIVHTSDDGTDEIIDLNTNPVFVVTIQWETLTESDAGTIWDFYHDPAKANRLARSFKYTHYAEGAENTYVARFAAPLPRKIRSPRLFSFSQVQLKIIGVSA